MRPPFPGMDPWLEDFELWPDVHKSLIVSIRDALTPLVIPRYFVRVDSRMTVLTGEDLDELYWPERIERDEIEECFLTVQERPGRQPVTAIEVLSPTNKRTKDVRQKYLDKRHDLMQAGVNLVEIDLLRDGQRMPLSAESPPSDYRILVLRPRLGRKANVYPFSYKMKIPQIPIPLLPQDPESSLDLNIILHALYERAGYDLAIDYRQPPSPRLRKADQPWAASIIAQVLPETPQAPAAGETAP